MPLSSAALDEFTTISAWKLLIVEWLSSYFNGQAHVIGANNPVTFPLVRAVCEQGAPTQPLVGTEIRVDAQPRTSERGEVVSGYLVSNRVIFWFLVRSAIAENAGGNAMKRSQDTAQLLKAILDNPESRYDLAQKGLSDLHPADPFNVSDEHYMTHIVRCPATFIYQVKFA